MTTTTPTVLRILDPEAETRAKERTPNPRVPTLDGKVVGILENAVGRSLDLSRLPELIRQRYEVRDIRVIRKPVTSLVAPKEQLERLIKECDVVITATAQ